MDRIGSGWPRPSGHRCLTYGMIDLMSSYWVLTLEIFGVGFRSHELDSRAAAEEWPVGVAFSFKAATAAATSSTILLGWNLNNTEMELLTLA